jgi:hypothetical protein
MAVTQREREDKFAVGARFAMPPLEALAPGQGEVVEEDLALRSTYYDTVGHDLLRCGVTLRREVGTVLRIRAPQRAVQHVLDRTSTGHLLSDGSGPA